MILYTRLLSLFFSVLTLTSVALYAQDAASIAKLKGMTDGGFNFIIATDLGRNGYYDQKHIANTMGIVADMCDAKFIIATGDTFHYLGVQSTQDPLFVSNFETIYSHPETQIPWYPVLGNHEYNGNSQALIDYSKVSRRWEMPDRYYAKSFKTKDDEVLDIFFIDTCPIIDRYREDTANYPDVVHQDRDRQLSWLETQLFHSKAKHKIVVGHHPIYADTNKPQSERLNMQKYVDPLLRKYGVDIYSAGHIHNFQHIRMPHSSVEYVVVASGSLTRKVSPIEGMVYHGTYTGFSLVSVKDGVITFYFLDRDANTLHQFAK